MKNRAEVNAIPSSYVVITTLVYALLAAICLELDNASGEEKDIIILLNSYGLKQ